MVNFNILIPNKSFIKYNYGAQGILLPLINKISKKMKCNIKISVKESFEDSVDFFSKNNNICVVRQKPAYNEKYGDYVDKNLIKIHNIYQKKIKKKFNTNTLDKEVENADLVLDTSGIEYIGNKTNF